VFLLPDGSPFYGGTYFPPEDSRGMPAFRRVAASVAEAYRQRGADVRRSAGQLRQLYSPPEAAPGDTGLTRRVAAEAVRRLEGGFDRRHAGFGGAPKFPPSMALSFLLTRWSRTGATEPLAMARRTFVAMARGGIFDQLGGGLHRYSVDERWLVPHFEKMLYDNALFVRLGIELWQATGTAEIGRAARATLDWISREMVSPEGGFYSSLDADSEGEEGTFYVWSAGEVAAAAGADAELALAAWGVTDAGNFEGRNVLHVAADREALGDRFALAAADVEARLERVRAALLSVRDRRERPARDDKIVAAWNGLMLRSIAMAARVFGDDRYRRLAIANAEFLVEALIVDGRVRRAWRDGAVRPEGFLEDQAAVALGLLELHGLTGERRWLETAATVAAGTVRHFRDPDSGVLYDTPDDHEKLIGRPRDPTDNATPSGTSLAAELLLRIAVLTDRDDYRRIGTAALEAVAGAAAEYPAAFGNALAAMDLVVEGSIEVVITGRDGPGSGTRALLDAVAASYVPSLTLLHGADGELPDLPIAAGKTPVGGEAAAYVCRRYECQRPVTEPAELSALLRAAIRGGAG
jgi:uncharacterized protein YyaL (SSP411 family)